MAEHTGGYGDEDLEEGSLGISVANGGRHGGEPLIGVAIVLVLDDLVEMKGHADDEGAQECSFITSSLANMFTHSHLIELELIERRVRDRV